MEDVKIIFFDIDGTLIDMNKKVISEKMLTTLRALKEKNILLCLATGRSPIALPQFQDVDFDAYLTFNGSYCFNQTESIHEYPIPSSDIKQIIENAQALNRPVAIATKDKTIANGKDDDSKITAWWDRAVDIIPAAGGKGTGIRKMLDYYGLDRSQAIAFGDGNNDIEMLAAIDWGLAMDNASEDLKAIADEVIGHVAEDGIYQFCLENGLI